MTLARLRGIRLVTASETGDGNRLDESLIKDITGGDRVVARFMRGEWFEFTRTSRFSSAPTTGPG
jgi:putative DNA primase/helicase